MAEQVQETLDQMVAPLRDLMDRGIFSEAEIKATVARRRESEYLLRRRVVRKADFLRYIEAEMDLEKLRAIRTRKLERGKRKLDSKAIGNIHVVQHIHTLFVRALRKFRSDISLHLQHAEFAKQSRSFTRLSRIYTEALQVHPRNVGLWIEAASIEYFGCRDEETGKILGGGGSVQTARVLMQRGLRVNSTSQDLWLQYFALEMHHVQKLRGRREILQITDERAESTAPRIPLIVYDNAIQKIPDLVVFRTKFLDLCRLFPQTDKIEAHIAASIERDFREKPEAWIARATQLIQETEKHEQTGFVPSEEEEANPKKRLKLDKQQDSVLSLLSDAAEALPNSEMYLQIILFVKTSELVEARDFIMEMYNNAKEKKEVSSDIVLEIAGLMESRGRMEDAISELQEFLQVQSDVAVYLGLVALLHKAERQKDAIKLLQSALKRTPLHDKGYMTMLLELFGAMLDTESDKNASDVFQQILLLSPGNSASPFPCTFGVGSVAQACLGYLGFLVKANRLEEAKRVVNAVVQSAFCKDHHPTEELDVMATFFDEALLLLQNQKGQRAKLHLRQLYKSAVEYFVDCSPKTANVYRKRQQEEIRFQG